jgi:predicted ATPase
VDAVVLVTSGVGQRRSGSIGSGLGQHSRGDDHARNNEGELDEAEINRVAGEIALLSPERDATKAEAYFARALEVARQQQAKSWELRAAMSMARLWRDQGKRREARDLLAPVYGWFTEGFETLDLREARALLDDLAL